MTYNLLRNALLAWLLHAGASFVLDSGSEAQVPAAVPMCSVPLTMHAAPYARSTLPPVAGVHP